MKRSVRETLLRLVILLIGLCIAHFGVTLFLLADIGSDPFNVFVQGLFRSLQKHLDFPLLTHGNVHIVVCCLIILILLFTDKKYVRIGTLVCMACGGPIIDLFTALLDSLAIGASSLWIKILCNALGCVILASGMGLVIKSDAGTGPNDLVSVVISDKLHAKFSLVRILVDVGFLLIGWLLDGSIGIGTLICAFLVGPVAGYLMPFEEKLVAYIIQKYRVINASRGRAN